MPRALAAPDTPGPPFATEPDHRLVLLRQAQVQRRWRRLLPSRQRRRGPLADCGAEVRRGAAGKDSDDAAQVVLAEVAVAGAEGGAERIAVLCVEAVEP